MNCLSSRHYIRRDVSSRNSESPLRWIFYRLLVPLVRLLEISSRTIRLLAGSMREHHFRVGVILFPFFKLRYQVLDYLDIDTVKTFWSV